MTIPSLASGPPENFLWKQTLPGVGRSSPVIWDDTLYLTYADPDTGAQIISAFDVANGARLWQKQFDAAKYHINDLNSLASSTPAVDDKYVFILWLQDGKVILAALNHAGQEVWRQDVGPFQEVHGFGISPIVVDDLVYVARASGARKRNHRLRSRDRCHSLDLAERIRHDILLYSLPARSERLTEIAAHHEYVWLSRHRRTNRQISMAWIPRRARPALRRFAHR